MNMSAIAAARIQLEGISAFHSGGSSAHIVGSRPSATISLVEFHRHQWRQSSTSRIFIAAPYKPSSRQCALLQRGVLRG